MYISTNLNIICITCLNVILSSYMHVSWNQLNIKTYDLTKKKMALPICQYSQQPFTTMMYDSSVLMNVYDRSLQSN